MLALKAANAAMAAIMVWTSSSAQTSQRMSVTERPRRTRQGTAVVAADRSGLPLARTGLQVRDDPDLRLGAALGHPELRRQPRSLNTSAVVPSKTVSHRRSDHAVSQQFP